MTLIVLASLFAFSLLFLIFSYHRTFVVLQLLAWLLIIIIGYGPVPKYLLQKIQPETPYTLGFWGEENLIVVLGLGLQEWPDKKTVRLGSLGYSRLFEAARLYKDCQRFSEKCWILISGGDPNLHGVSEAEVMQKEFESIGLPVDRIILEKISKNTFQNAQFSARIIKDKPWSKIILVSSGIHVRRSQLYFRHFGVEAEVAPSDFLQVLRTTVPLASHFFLTDLTIHEILGIARYHIYNTLGWNVKADRPGDI